MMQSKLTQFFLSLRLGSHLTCVQDSDFLYFPSRHIYNQSPRCFGAVQILTNLSSVVLARLGCRGHIAFPVDNNLRPALLTLGDCIDDAGYCSRFAVPSSP